MVGIEAEVKIAVNFHSYSTFQMLQLFIFNFRIKLTFGLALFIFCDANVKNKKNNWKIMNLLQAVNDNNVDEVREILRSRRDRLNLTDNHNFTGEYQLFLQLRRHQNKL